MSHQTPLTKLEGITIVTFGNRDTCKAFGYALACAGSHVAILYRSSEEEQEVSKLIKEIQNDFPNFKVRAYQCDLCDIDRLGETLKQIEGANEFEGAKITGLIADADTSVVESALKLSHDDFQRVFDANVYSVFNTSRAAAQLWENNGNRRGSIVIISSMSAQIVNQRASNKALTQAFYNSSKAAVRHLSRALAAEWANRHIRVNTVSPGYVESKETKTDEETLRHQRENVPLGRFAKPEEITGQVLLLLSPYASYMTGGDYVVDGGQLVW